ncbi:MAG: hypothetical protein KF866_09380 [Phycisphaeraceae bacterium]|nr:hypothetical protein [Phycisphaeraceae bacterium]MCW5754709.1 hypothetical protein [Phycisphaeraceae bacterium]
MNHGVLAVTIAGLAASAGAHVVHSNISNQTSAFQGITNFDPNLSMVDDLRPDFGGELASLTFTYGYSGGFGGPGAIMLDIAVALYLDDGDGAYDPTVDAPLFSGLVSDLVAVQGQIHQTTIAFPSGIMIPDGATVWLSNAYQPDAFGFLNLGVGLYNDYTRGGSDSNVYIYDSDTGTVSAFFQFDGAGVGAVLRIVPTPSAAAVLGLAGVAALRRRR